MTEQNVRVVGRYALYGAIAAGGMATVHLGRLLGPVGFSRTVAIKRLHAQFASDPEFVSMFLDEARLAARIRHPNVVPTLDVVATGGELFLVMDYVPGESIARLSRALRERQQTLPLRILSATMAGVLHGLHAAHEAKDERGHPLGIVHRDVSPQNVLVGTDGVPRVLDFGVAKAAGRVQTTKEGQIKGKLSYMPPEQLRGAAVSRQTDIYAVGVMLWELVTGQRLFTGDNEGAVVARVLEGRVERPSVFLMRTRKQTLQDHEMRTLESLDQTILRALSMQAEARFATAREMAIELERKCPPATVSEVGDWVEHIARDVLTSRAAMIAEIESSASMTVDGRDNHVMSVLNAKSTLGPSSSLGRLRGGSYPPSAPPLPGSMRPMQGAPTARQGSMPPTQGALTPPQGSFGPERTTGRPTGPSLPPFMPYGGPIDGPPVTQPSSISVSTPGSMTRAHDASARRTMLAVLLGVMIGASVLAAALVFRYAKRPTTAVAPPPDPTFATEPSGSPSAVTSAPVPSSTATAAPVEEVEAVIDAGAVHATATPKAPSVTRGTKSGAKSTPSAVDDCSTPYWYDAQNVKHYKEHCLKK